MKRITSIGQTKHCKITFVARITVATNVNLVPNGLPREVNHINIITVTNIIYCYLLHYYKPTYTISPNPRSISRTWQRTKKNNKSQNSFNCAKSNLHPTVSQQFIRSVEVKSKKAVKRSTGKRISMSKHQMRVSPAWYSYIPHVLDRVGCPRMVSLL